MTRTRGRRSHGRVEGPPQAHEKLSCRLSRMEGHAAQIQKLFGIALKREIHRHLFFIESGGAPPGVSRAKNRRRKRFCPTTHSRMSKPRILGKRVRTLFFQMKSPRAISAQGLWKIHLHPKSGEGGEGGPIFRRGLLPSLNCLSTRTFRFPFSRPWRSSRARR